MSIPESVIQIHLVRNRLQVYLLNGPSRKILCSLDLRERPTFYTDHGEVVCQLASGHEFRFDGLSYDESQLLMDGVASAMKRSEWGKRATVIAAIGAIGAVAVAGLLWLTPHIGQTAAGTPSAPKAPAWVAQETSPPLPPSLPVTAAAPAAPVDGWELPAPKRTVLADNLAKAAARDLFTVTYSQGHARTLYVFADPACPNCQRLEPALKSAAETVNVVVFPVAVIGGDQSVDSISKVLCLPANQRAQAWEKLLDPLNDMPKPGQAAQAVDAKPAIDGACESAKQALGVNEVAYQTYRIPGTPWVISDDGRHVPQSVVRDRGQLEAWLKKENHDGAK